MSAGMSSVSFVEYVIISLFSMSLPLGVFAATLPPGNLEIFQSDEMTEAEFNDLNAIAFDCNHNGVSDRDDIDTGYSQDKNQDDQPDECEPGQPGYPPKPTAYFYLIRYGPMLAAILILTGAVFLVLACRRR